jgi:hypothetical protein
MLSRRELLAFLLSQTAVAAPQPTGPGEPHHTPLAKHVILIYMSGAYSHVDTFDPKPRLTKEHDVSIGKEGKSDFERYLKSPLWPYRANPRCGTEVSDLFPYIREVMDSAALIRSMHCDQMEHGAATLQLHTGSFTIPMPSMGAWLSYALRPLNPNLPAHVVIAEQMPYGGAQPWGNSFFRRLPAGFESHPAMIPSLISRPLCRRRFKTSNWILFAI